MKKTLNIPTNDTKRKFYFLGIFKRYIDNLFNEVELVKEKEFAVFDQFFIYHIRPQNVTLHYKCDMFGSFQVTLFGSNEGVGEVEKIILEGIKEGE